MTVRISNDAVALACGADAVAAAFAAAGVDVERVSSWGMHWMEPLVYIDGVGYGQVSADQVPSTLSGDAQSIGRIEDHPFIAKQNRLTFARAGKTRPTSLDDYYATGGWLGLDQARAIGADATIETIMTSGLRGRGGAGFPAGIKWRTVADAPAEQKYIV